jgi:hypothetical protein
VHHAQFFPWSLANDFAQAGLEPLSSQHFTFMVCAFLKKKNQRFKKSLMNQFPMIFSYVSLQKFRPFGPMFWPMIHLELILCVYVCVV